MLALGKDDMGLAGFSNQPQRGDDAHREAHATPRARLWGVVCAIAIVVCAVALGLLAFRGLSYWLGQKTYSDLADDCFAVAASDATADALPKDRWWTGLSADWDALWAVNPEVAGWVYVPETDVSYPVAHRVNDSEYYLSHDISGQPASALGAQYGCIMLAGENSADFSDDLNVIYGHNMANGTMFAALAQFADSAVANAHRDAYVIVPSGVFRLNLIAVDRVLGSDTTIVVPNFDTREQLVAYVQARLDGSIVTLDAPAPDPAGVGQLFALSTCDGADDAYRIVAVYEVAEFAPADASGEAAALPGELAKSGGERVLESDR